MLKKERKEIKRMVEPVESGTRNKKIGRQQQKLQEKEQ